MGHGTALRTRGGGEPGRSRPVVRHEDHLKGGPGFLFLPAVQALPRDTAPRPCPPQPDGGLLRSGSCGSLSPWGRRAAAALRPRGLGLSPPSAHAPESLRSRSVASAAHSSVRLRGARPRLHSRCRGGSARTTRLPEGAPLAQAPGGSRTSAGVLDECFLGRAPHTGSGRRHCAAEPAAPGNPSLGPVGAWPRGRLRPSSVSLSHMKAAGFRMWVPDVDPVSSAGLRAHSCLTVAASLQVALLTRGCPHGPRFPVL